MRVGVIGTGHVGLITCASFAAIGHDVVGTDADRAKIDALLAGDMPFHEPGVADSIRDNAPFVVTFATPAFCTSRACGPVVDVVDHVRRTLRGAGIRFIHVEIYEDNQPANGVNRWVRQWNLPTEPWVFVVGRDGLVKERYEGSVSVGELTAAVRRHLVR